MRAAAEDNPYRPPQTRVDGSPAPSRGSPRFFVAATVLMPIYGLLGALAGLLLGALLLGLLETRRIRLGQSWEWAGPVVGAMAGVIIAGVVGIYLSRRDRR